MDKLNKVEDYYLDVKEPVVMETIKEDLDKYRISAYTPGEPLGVWTKPIPGSGSLSYVFLE